MDIQSIILAAGKGSRMKSQLPKVLHQLAGKSLVQHVIDTCSSLSVAHCHLVVGHGADQVKQSVTSNRMQLHFVEQTEQLGTGHAVKVALPSLKTDSLVLILYGDVPLIHHDTLDDLIKLQQKNPQGIALMTCFLDDPTGYGRITRDDDGLVTGIVEHKDATPEQHLINEINTGIMCCHSSQLKKWIANLNNNNAQGEFYLTDIIAMAVAEGQGVATAQPINIYETEGINTLRQLADLERIWQREMANQLMDAGVTFRDPNRFDLRGSLTCEAGVVIDINCVVEGNVQLKQDVHIGPNVYLKNVTIGENSVIKANTFIENSQIADHCDIGPFARIRPEAQIKSNVHIGNFVEVKKSILSEGAKVGHLSYVGDSEVGKNVNIGAGTITCNYDGANKHKTIIEDDAFIGSDTQLVAPVTVGKGATVAAGTTVSADVSPGALCISRVRQKQIEHWQRPTKKK
ncbi:MAG: bifunctional UDP-N-acetylglucosamine diphosphorylase/glucosamine-1-phosphate N-acetyltransferase GlmU [Enterobacterales bacterium]|nr:bifunctional UDP-N-acetylglucosamine diphosphorylase/glucosamine-1-phosphate N-acetyltransferase GlmU [Enterobacterales bacterium]